MANVVLDGADGILLGAETLRGRFPVLTVDTIMKICRQAETVFDHVNHFDHLMQARPPWFSTGTLMLSCCVSRCRWLHGYSSTY